MTSFLRYFFYKNFAFAFSQFLFAFFCGFTAQVQNEGERKGRGGRKGRIENRRERIKRLPALYNSIR